MVKHRRTLYPFEVYHVLRKHPLSWLQSTKSQVMIKIKRVYDDPEDDDGKRYLVDRLWPRGIKKENLKLDSWLKEIAPSTDLRKWFHHEDAKWEEFVDAYRSELEGIENWKPLAKEAKNGTITLLYAAKNREHNHAVVLKDFLDDRIG